MKKLSILIFLLILTMVGYSQDSSSSEKEMKEKPQVNMVWLPVIASSPANGWMFGVAPAANWVMGDPQTTSISNVLASLIYTTQKQLLFTFKGTQYFDGDKYSTLLDWRYFDTSQPTFGLGTGPQSAKLVSSGLEYEDGLVSQGIDEAQFMAFKFLRLHQTFLLRSGKSRFFYGLGYHYDKHFDIDDALLNLDTVPPAITSHYAYSQTHGFDTDKYTLSGASLNALYDSRDNTINPYGGWYAFARFKYNPTWLGSTKNSTELWTEFRDYFSISEKRPRNILALWLYGSFNLSGELPYLDLPALGWDQYGRSGRAYPQGRFRGQQIVYGELEWRFPLQKDHDKWGGVLFFNTNSASNKDADIPLFEYVNIGYGLGIRYMVNEQSRTNICLDYGFGDYGASGFYLSVNEAF